MTTKYDEMELVKEYTRCHRLRIVAAKFGCSDETVRRALIKNNVPRIIGHKRPVTRPRATEEELRQIAAEYEADGVTIDDLAKKHKRAQTTISKAIKTYGNGLKPHPLNILKITDDELRTAAKTMTCQEIAKAYSMSEEQVYRRAKSIGLKIEMGWSGGHWRRRSNRYGCNDFDGSISLRSLFIRDKGVCQICGMPTDPHDIENGHIRKNYPTLDHIVPLSKGGSHTWGNVQLAHMKCNAGKCDKEGEYEPSRCRKKRG